MFWKMSYDMGWIDINTMKEATKWGCITPTEFKTITGEDYG